MKPVDGAIGEFLLNNDVASVSPLARLLFLGLCCLADQEGDIQDIPDRIKAHILPYDTDADCEELLMELRRAGLIERTRENDDERDEQWIHIADYDDLWVGLGK